jgi:preprotein translocase subunit SecD
MTAASIGLVGFAVGAAGLYLLFTLIFPGPPDFAQTGGYVFVYGIDVSAGQDDGRVIERVIGVLKERVDPRGARGVAFRRLTENRIEIRVPVPLDVRSRRHVYLEAREVLLDANLDETELDRILDLPKVARATPNGSVSPSRSFREEAWQRLTAANPDRAIQIETLANAYSAYEEVKNPLDDPEDLMRLLRGAGVLEFRIAVRASKPEGVNPDDLREQLTERGPENTDSPVARWFPINDLKQWYDKLEQLVSLQADPVAFFGRPGLDLVAAERDGHYYLLLYTTDNKSMSHGGKSQWSVDSAFRTTDRLGRPAVGFRLDPPGGGEMNRLTRPHVGEPLAIILDGHVFSAPTLQSQIGISGIITGTFSEAELDYLIRVLAAGSLEANLSSDPISVREVGAETP